MSTFINGNVYDFSSVEAKFNGVSYPITKIDYESELDPGEVRGNQAQVMGHTRGELKTTQSMSMIRRHADAFMDALGDGFMEVLFEVVVSFGDEGQPTRIDTIGQARVKKRKDSGSKGNEGLETEFEMVSGYILYNGKAPIRGLRR